MCSRGVKDRCRVRGWLLNGVRVGIRDGCTRTGVGVEWVMMERHT